MSMFRQLVSRFIRLSSRTCIDNARRNVSVFGGVALAAMPVAMGATCSPSKTNVKIDPDELTASYLVKMAAIQTVNSASTLLTQTLATLLTVLHEYEELLARLVKLLELHAEVYGGSYQEQRVWDAILQTRLEIAEIKLKQDKLDTIFFCAEKSLEAAGEASLASGCQYGSQAASERLFSANQQLQNNRSKLDAAKARVDRTEAKCIEIITDKTQKQAESETLTTEDAEESSTESNTESGPDPDSDGNVEPEETEAAGNQLNNPDPDLYKVVFTDNPSKDFQWEDNIGHEKESKPT